MTSSSTDRLEGRVALVTGATRGIGRAIACVLARHGAEVYVNGRQAADTERAAFELGEERGRVVALPFDVGDAKAVKGGFETLFKRSGGLDVLVNSAGILRSALISLTSDALLDEVMRINFTGTFLCCRAAVRLMSRRGGGSIVNLTSIVGRVGVEGYTAYGASKAAVIGLTHSLAKEVAAQKIRVNAIAPGFIETDMVGELTPEQRGKALSQIRMGRAGTSEDVAGAALFLASDLSAYVTGQVLGVDGAMTP